jgi:acyl-CoA dehydrogenase
MGLFGTNTPSEYGGLGLSMLGSCLAIEEVAKAHTAFSEMAAGEWPLCQ